MPLVTAKSSTIFISTASDTRVYHSLHDVPPSLRRRLEETTRSSNSATILIADRRGQQELARALEGQPSVLQSRLAEAIRLRKAEEAAQRKREQRLSWMRRWAEFLLPVAIGAGLWALMEFRF